MVVCAVAVSTPYPKLNNATLFCFVMSLCPFRVYPKSAWWRYAGRIVTPWPWRSLTTRGRCSYTRDTCSGCGMWMGGGIWIYLLVCVLLVWATATRKSIFLFFRMFCCDTIHSFVHFLYALIPVEGRGVVIPTFQQFPTLSFVWTEK